MICGHIHHAAIHNYGGLIYMNSGDWVETMSALVEDYDGTWSLLYYTADLAENTESDGEATTTKRPTLTPTYPDPLPFKSPVTTESTFTNQPA